MWCIHYYDNIATNVTLSIIPLGGSIKSSLPLLQECGNSRRGSKGGPSVAEVSPNVLMICGFKLKDSNKTIIVCINTYWYLVFHWLQAVYEAV